MTKHTERTFCVLLVYWYINHTAVSRMFCRAVNSVTPCILDTSLRRRLSELWFVGASPGLGLLQDRRNTKPTISNQVYQRCRMNAITAVTAAVGQQHFGRYSYNTMRAYEMLQARRMCDNSNLIVNGCTNDSWTRRRAAEWITHTQQFIGHTSQRDKQGYFCSDTNRFSLEVAACKGGGYMASSRWTLPKAPTPSVLTRR